MYVDSSGSKPLRSHDGPAQKSILANILSAVTSSQKGTNASDYLDRVVDLSGKKRKIESIGENDYNSAVKLKYRPLKRSRTYEYEMGLYPKLRDGVLEKRSSNMLVLMETDDDDDNGEEDVGGANLVNKVLRSISTRGVVEGSVVFDHESRSCNIGMIKDIATKRFQLSTSGVRTNKVSLMDMVEEFIADKTCMVCDATFSNMRNMGGWKCEYTFERKIGTTDTYNSNEKFSKEVRCRMDHVSTQDAFELYIRESMYDIPLKKEVHFERLTQLRRIPENILNWMINPIPISVLNFVKTKYHFSESNHRSDKDIIMHYNINRRFDTFDESFLCVFETIDDIKKNSKIVVEYPFGEVEVDVVKLYANFLSTIDAMTFLDEANRASCVVQYNDANAWKVKRTKPKKTSSLLSSILSEEEDGEATKVGRPTSGKSKIAKPRNDYSSQIDRIIAQTSENGEYTKQDNSYNFVPFFIISRMEFISAIINDKAGVVEKIHKLLL